VVCAALNGEVAEQQNVDSTNELQLEDVSSDGQLRFFQNFFQFSRHFHGTLFSDNWRCDAGGEWGQ